MRAEPPCGGGYQCEPHGEAKRGFDRAAKRGFDSAAKPGAAYRDAAGGRCDRGPERDIYRGTFGGTERSATGDVTRDARRRSDHDARADAPAFERAQRDARDFAGGAASPGRPAKNTRRFVIEDRV